MTTLDDGPENYWRRSLKEGRFLLQKDLSTGLFNFPPRVCERAVWVEASGAGVVYSVTTIPPHGANAGYNVVLVDLDEGPRLMSRVEGLDPGVAFIGMRVVARIAHDEGEPILVFDPA
jgi:uncharacterized OB-fold protein